MIKPLPVNKLFPAFGHPQQMQGATVVGRHKNEQAKYTFCCNCRPCSQPIAKVQNYLFHRIIFFH